MLMLMGIPNCQYLMIQSPTLLIFKIFDICNCQYLMIQVAVSPTLYTTTDAAKQRFSPRYKQCFLKEHISNFLGVMIISRYKQYFLQVDQL